MDDLDASPVRSRLGIGPVIVLLPRSKRCSPRTRQRSIVTVTTQVALLLTVSIGITAGSPPPLMRWIRVLQGQKIHLGRQVPKNLRHILDCAEVTRCNLRRGTFMGASDIELGLSHDGQVKRVTFRYGDVGSFDARVEHFSREFRRTPSVTEDGRTRRARWEDSETIFEIVWSGGAVESIIIDK